MIRIDRERLRKLPPSERKEAERLLAELEAKHEANPLLRYNAPWSPKRHPKQLEFHAAQTKIKLYIGGNRAGKTTAGIVDDLIQCVDEEALPDHLKQYKKWQPPVRARIVAPKFNENIEQVILPAIRQWCPRDQLLDASWEKAFSKQRRVLTFANGSTIQFLTFDQDLDAHAGAALHRVHFDEEPEGDKGRALWHENMMRLGDYDGDFIMTMTPLFGLSWSYEEIYSRRDREPDITVITVDSLDNPHVNRDALEREFARMTKEERQARKEGRFVHFAGQFFPEFSLETHGCKPPSREHIQQQSVVVGIDPGLNRTGVVWVAFDNDNVALVFDELYPEQAIVEQIVENIRTVNRKWGIEPDYYVIDPSARNRATINAEAVQSAYMRAGIPTVQGQNDRAAGILEMKRRLQQNGLVVSAACTNLAYEFERYRRDPNSQDEFAAIKKDDHLLDALRYALMSRPWAMDAAPDAGPEFWTPGRAPSHEWLAAGGPVSSHPLGNLT